MGKTEAFTPGDEDPINIDSPTDQTIRAVARAEQRKMRQLLLNGEESALCGICGLTTEARHLVAAHIKPRFICSERERRDPDVVMLACVFGCDSAFEDDGIRVIDEGRILINRDLLRSRPKLFRQLDGGIAPAFDSHTEKYFKDKANTLEM